MGEKGYIKLWRRLFEHPIWLNSTPEQKCILIALMEMANHKDNKWEWKGEEFTVKRGQMVTSTKSIREACGKGITSQNVKTAIARFEKLGFLTNESTNSGRLITIENYCKWQGLEREPNQVTNQDLTNASPTPNQDLTNASPTPNQDLTTNKNDKNVRIIYTEPEALNVAVISFIEFRKKIKKPMTDRAIELMLKKLKSMSNDTAEQIEILEQSIINGWIGIFPLKGESAKEIEQPRKKYG